MAAKAKILENVIMSTEPSTTPAWKQTAPSAASSRGAAPSWRQGTSRSGAGPLIPTRRIALGMTWLSFLFFCAALVWVATWVSPPKNVALLLLGAGYEDNPVFPPNCAGQAFLRELAEVVRKPASGAQRSNYLLRLVQGRVQELRTETPWDASLAGISESTLLIIMSGHGGTDSKGAFVLPTNANARVARLQRLYMETVLYRLEKMASSRKIVLILDVTQMPSHWPLGMLHNDFARGMKALEPRIASNSNLVVILSSGEDQLSWASHDWRKTIFGHYVIESLRGGAGQDSSQKINALELFDFCSKGVSHWARANRAAEQTPILLPGDGEGRARAEAIVLNIVDRRYLPADPEKLDELQFIPEAITAWDGWKRLRSAIFSPEARAPHAWQQYQTALLHYETALRMGDSATAKKKKERLSQLEGVIADAGDMTLRSRDATLAMSALDGFSEEKDTKGTEAFVKKLWEAKNDEEAKDLWEEARKSLWKDRPVPVRALAIGILERVAQEKIAGLPRGAQRLRLLRQGDLPLPAEAHWVLMMQRDLPASARAQPETGELFALALSVRMLAEQCAVSWSREAPGYSGRIMPWIAETLGEADLHRQIGQDLLLGTRKVDADQAGERLMLAKKAYERADQQAQVVRQALVTRDRVLAALPAYSHWIARRPAYSLPKPPLVDPQLEGAVKEIWQLVHGLNQALTAPHKVLPVAGAKLPAGAPGLIELTQRTGQQFDALEKRFDQHLQSLLVAPVIPSDNMRYVWLETEAALLVPHANVSLRMDLLRRQHQKSRLLLLEIGSPATATPPLPPGADAAVKQQARREGEMALALLGPTWFDRFAGPKQSNYVQMRHRLEVAPVEEKWYDSIRLAGERIGQDFRRMPVEINRLLTPAPKAEKETPGVALEEADLLARRMEGTQPMPQALHPVQEYRRMLLGNLLIAQAGRTYQDHWYDENPTAEPYYGVVARSFLADARSQLSTGKRDVWSGGLKQAIAAWDKKLQNSGELMIRDITASAAEDAARGPGGAKTLPGELFTPRASKVAVVTSEQLWERDYRVAPLRAGDDVPPGFAVWWLDDSTNVRAVEPKFSQRVALPVLPDAGQPEAGSQRFLLQSPLIKEAEERNVGTIPPGPPESVVPLKERSSLKVRGLFRGQILRQETPVDLYPQPTTIIRQYPVPERASLAVRTDRGVTVRSGTNNSGVTFVLDCSGSMGVPEGTDYKQGRYYQAVEALRVVLQKIPQGTTVSVLTFGQSMGPDSTAEQTIQHAVNPILWNVQDPKQLTSLIDVLHGMQPWNKSPIMRTLVFAQDDLNFIRGNKTVVVITDGHDNRFEQDKELVDRFKDVPTLLRETFDKTGTSLHMVLFTPLDEEEKKAQEQYKLIESFKPAGRIHALADIGKLALLLEAVMRQRLNYWVDRTGQNITVNEIPESGLDVSTSDKNDRWYSKGLPPGGHKVRVNIPERIEKDVVLHRGDLLLLDLVESRQGTMFERYLFSDDYPWKRRLENMARDWRLSVLQNQLVDKNGLQMLVSVEKTVDRRESILEQIKPRDCWIELKLPPEVNTEISTRWSFLSGFPAPAWSIDVPRWPSYPGTTAAARPVLTVWWNPDEEARSGAELQVLPLMAEKNRAVVVQNEKNVVVESVTIEKHYVEVRRGVVELRSCLVVRMRHELNRPIITRMEFAEQEGAEHRLYARAGKYTGLYWFADEKAALETARLRIISIPAFKEEAERRGYVLQVRDLNAPDATDYRPRTPLELK